MRAMQEERYLVKVDLPATSAGGRRLAQAASRSIESLLDLSAFNRMYHCCSEGSPDWRTFIQRLLSFIRARWTVAAQDLARIPRTGPLVVVANHTFGGLDGIVLPAILGAVRDDVKIMATTFLERARELHDIFIMVDPLQRDETAGMNASALRMTMRHLKQGGVLGVFPAGEVASFNLQSREIADPQWSTTIAGIIRRCKCPVLPIFFDGRNSMLFQMAGLIHPRLRTVLLAHEYMNKRGVRLSPRIGSVIPFKRLEGFATDREMINYLRHRTYMLQHRRGGEKAGTVISAAQGNFEPIIAPVAPDVLAGEVASLSEENVLVDADDCVVYQARAAQIPNVLRELSRLREITFRATGEGTGKSCDVDRFDDHYVHLFIWQRQKNEIVGAYRLGPTDEILDTRGKAGLYTSTLFECKTVLLRHITPALELGRSFVRAEYQKSFSPLLLLWKGIGQYIVRYPRYKYLFGPVSISNNYHTVSKQLMVSFLKAHHCPPELVDLAHARNPFRAARIAGWDRSAVRLIRDSEDVSDLVSDLEPQSKGIPVLLRQYLRMGAKLLAFNVDPAFGDCVDALMVCDLTKTDARLLDRYMGKDGRERFMQHHADRARPAERISAVVGAA